MLRTRQDPDGAGAARRIGFADLKCTGACISIVSVFSICCVVFAAVCGRGFNISDDAYYILSAADASLYKQTLTEFGYALHPAFAAVGGNLALFRFLGAAFLLGCATLFAFATCNAFLPRDQEWKLYACGIGAIATSAFWQYGLWLPTPNYNLLNLCGLLLFFSGLSIGAPPSQTFSSSPKGCRDLGGAVIAGLGLCLTLLTKPTTSLMAVVAGLAWIAVASPRRAWRAILTAALVSVSCYALAIFFIDGSLAQFLARKSFSLRALAVLGRGHDLSGLEQSLLGSSGSHTLSKFLSVGAGCLVFLLLVSWWFRALRKGTGQASIIAVGCVFLVAVVRAWDGLSPEPVPLLHVWHLLPLIVAAILFLAAAGSLQDRHGAWRQLTCIAILGIAPLIYSVGTNNTVALHISGAAIFWSAAAILAAEMMIPKYGRQVVAGTALLFACLTLAMLFGVIISPLPGASPLWAQSQRLSLRNHMVVKVDARTLTYFSAFQAAAARKGLSEGTPIIDLTGQGPGMVLVLRGTAPGVPWLHYGGANVMAFSRLMLRQVPAERLHAAWVVTSPGPDTAREALVLRNLGIDFPRHFEAVISRRAPEIGMAHTLWRPH